MEQKELLKTCVNINLLWMVILQVRVKIPWEINIWINLDE